MCACWGEQERILGEVQAQFIGNKYWLVAYSEPYTVLAIERKSEVMK